MNKNISTLKFNDGKNGSEQQQTLNVLGIGSSMRKDSFGTETLRIILKKVSENGGKTQLLNLF